MSRWRLVLKDEDGKDSEPIIRVKSKGESQEFIVEGNSDVSSESEGDIGPTKDDPPIYGMFRGIMIVERMREIVL